MTTDWVKALAVLQRAVLRSHYDVFKKALQASDRKSWRWNGNTDDVESFHICTVNIRLFLLGRLREKVRLQTGWWCSRKNSLKTLKRMRKVNFWGIKQHCLWTKKWKIRKWKKTCDDAFRWSMPNTPDGRPEMLCTTVNIGSRWWDEHFRLNLFQYSPISFSFASHFEIFSRFKPWWTFIRFHFSKKQILFSLLSHFWSRYHFRLFLLSFFLHSRAGGRATLIYSVGRGGPTAFFL